MAKKPSKAPTNSRPARDLGAAAAPENLPGFDPGALSGPSDPAEELVMPVVTPSPQPETPRAEPVTAQSESTAAADDLPPLSTADPVADGPSATGTHGGGWRFGRSELVALAGFALLGLISTIWFFRCLYAHPAELGLPETPKHFPHPLKGKFLTLAAADTGWRDRVAADHVRAEEVILPTLHAKLDPAGSSQGFLRIEFIDTEGKIRGDISTVAIEGGRFKDSGRGEQVSADGTEVTVTGTVGFEARSLFTIYLGGEETRWSIRLREGPDYSNGPWSLIGQARITDHKP